MEVHEQTLAKVVAFKEKKADGIVKVNIPDDDENNETDDIFTLRKGSINLADMKNLGGFERALRIDINKLRAICESLDAFAEDYKNGFEQDLKLEKLISILEEKRQASNKKVVIFTAYADTAEFIYDELRKRGFSNMASVSGQEIHTTGNHSTNNFNEVLQSFAPYSKLYKELDWSDLYEEAKLSRADYYDDDKRRWNVPFALWEMLISERRPNVKRLMDDSIDILIATDCLSEGQNLQDADMQINYDIHWNPVRLIQRFGRIDRIGSPCESVRCVNFWPAKSFEEYLHLETRIMNRMVTMNLVGSETQQLNDAYLKMEADNPLQDKNADRLLEELQNNSISDIESPRTLSLKDFSFEVYRQDLIDYFEKHKEVFHRMPNGIFSGFKFDDTLFEKIPESLVAVIGYPHREQGNNRAYSEIYLMCQPADPHISATYQNLNRAEVLEFLRKNKSQERFVPEWIEANNKERLQKLSNIIQQWMEAKVPQQATAAILQIAKSRKTTHKLTRQEKDTQLLEDKFKKENFDLIVWEYVSK